MNDERLVNGVKISWWMIFTKKNLREKTFSSLFELQGPSQKFHK